MTPETLLNLRMTVSVLTFNMLLTSAGVKNSENVAKGLPSKEKAARLGQPLCVDIQLLSTLESPQWLRRVDAV
jgi:hypothetical protein